MLNTFPQLSAATKDLQTLYGADENAVSSLGDLALLQAKGAAKGSAKSLAMAVGAAIRDPENYKLSASKVRESILKGIGKGMLSETGGWFSWAKWFWSTKDLSVKLLKPGPPVVKVIEFGVYVIFDVIQPVGEFVIKAKKDQAIKELLQTYDVVLAVYTNSANRFRDEMNSVMKDVYDTCKSINDSFKSGFNKNLLAVLDELAKTNPDLAAKWQNFFRPGILKQLRYLRELQLRMYGTNASAYVFLSCCQCGQADNTFLGFPSYTGFVSPNRAAVLNSIGGDLIKTLLHSVKQMGRLEKFIARYWKTLGKRVGISEEEFA